MLLQKSSGKEPENMKKKYTFTLVEILTAAAIIGILAGISLGVTRFVQNKNREVQTQTTIKLIEMALESYKTKYGNYPAVNGKPENNIGSPFFKVPVDTAGDDSLSSLFSDLTLSGDNITAIKGINTTVNGGNLIFLDGWGSPIVYLYPGVFNRTKYDLGSAGPNKQFGDEGALFTRTTIPACGTRTTKTATDLYRKNFGKADDITNFKRTDL